MNEDHGGQGGRRGRNASRSNRAKSKLESLVALREKGSRRAEEYQLKEEEAIFDVVDDLEYTALVAERRNKYGDFVVEDGGAGYVDIGEEDDWNVDYYKEEREREEREEREAGRKRKESSSSGSGAEGSKRKEKKKSKKQSTTLLSDAADQTKKLDKMFLAATAAGPKRGGISLGQASAGQGSNDVATDGQADALLEDILGDLDTNVSGEDLRQERVRAQPAAEVQGNPFSRPRAQPRPASAGKRSFAPPPAQQENDDPMLGLDPPFEQEEEAPEVPASVEEERAPRPQQQQQQQQEQAVGVPEKEKEGASDAPMKSAWETMCEDDVEINVASDAKDAVDQGSPAEVAMEVEGSQETLDFYFLDVHSENSMSSVMKGSVYMFGKVRDGKGGFQSCSVIVKNLQRNVFFVPKPSLLEGDMEAIEELETKVKEGDKQARGKLMRLLHAKLGDLKNEIRGLLTARGVNKFTLVPVKRDYAFEVEEVPKGMQWVVKVKYSAQLPELSQESSQCGEFFCGMFGARTSTSEHLILKRKLKGPGWLKVSNPTRVPQESQITWCKQEYQVESPKLVSVSEGSVSHPPLTVAAVNLKTHVAPNQTTPEIISCTVMYIKQVQTDLPTPKDQWNTLKQLRHFSCVRRLDGQPFPVGFEKECQQRNASKVGKLNGNSIISHFNSERALLCNVVARLRALDPDVLVGHNVLAFDLDVLYARMIHLKVPHWSRVGRMKRSSLPYGVDKKKSSSFGNTLVGSTISTGRLVCDTYLSAREFVRQSDYSLKALSRELLGETKVEMSSSMDMSSVFYSSKDLFQLVTLAEQDAWLSLGLMFHLSVLPLTRQLTNLSGFQWTKVLRGGRAQRIEYLLLHEFHGRKFMVPDKQWQQKDQGAKDKKAKYAGGLVLDPKSGLYDDIVMMLDFNSLYPSIIQEFGICWTTVERPNEGEMAKLPDEGALEGAVLPAVISGLVQRRREVKKLLKQETDVGKKQQLDIRQQALKLTANSMYGCLGFSQSRFCARPLAELVTFQGREILQQTARVAEEEVGVEVVYGDTDSIFIDTKVSMLEDALKIGRQLRLAVNKRYKLLEIEIDAVFVKLLLLKKKKYAAVKVEGGQRVVELKGLDLVRRDWSLLAKDIGRSVLDTILGEKDQEDMVETVLGKLKELGDAVRNGKLGIGKYAITKQLTKDPSAYPDAKSQPHVQVALRRKAKGHREGTGAGETVPYVISTSEEGEGGALAERAYGLDEMKEGERKPDVAYYLSQQIMPLVSRLTNSIDGLSSARVAEALGLDGAKYLAQERIQESREDDAMFGSTFGSSTVNAKPFEETLLQGTPTQVANRVRMRVSNEISEGSTGSELYMQLRAWAKQLEDHGAHHAKSFLDRTLERSAFNHVPKTFWNAVC